MTDLIKDIADYYTGRLAQYGITPRGVDWNGEDGQRLRFGQLARLLPEADFSLNDLGCGYGALYGFLAQTHVDMRYTGYDVSPAMVAAARATLPAGSARVIQADTPTDRQTAPISPWHRASSTCACRAIRWNGRTIF